MTKLSVGDSLYRLALPDSDGNLVNFSSHALGGRPIVLWIVTSPSPGDAARLIPLLPAFSTCEAVVYGVVQGKPASPLPMPADLPLLFDPEQRLPGAFGLSGESLAVLDADLRLAAVFQGSAFEEAFALCGRLFERSAPDTIRAQAPVHVMHNLLEPELCRALIHYWEVSEKQADQVSVTLPVGKQSLPDIKKRKDVLLDDPSLLDSVRGCINRRLVPEVFKVFSYRISNFEGLRIGCYDAADGGYFRRHRDNTTLGTAGRRFAVSINLNSGEYEGGQVRFPEYSRGLYAPDAGGAVVFSCSLWHEAMPVTAGRRFGAFTFAFEQGKT